MQLKQPNIANHYAKMQIETASRQKQLTMLHEKCVQFILSAMQESGFEKRMLLDSAQNILVQFQAALRMEDSVSQSLFYIYDYAYALLERGDTDDCKKAGDIMSVIRDTFRELLLTI